MLTYDEFAYGVRERLKLKRSELADSALQALWCSLDGDESGFIESGEFHRFVGKSGPPGGTTIERRQELLRAKTAKKMELQREIEEREMQLEGFNSSFSTAAMRAELKSAGVREPTASSPGELTA